MNQIQLFNDNNLNINNIYLDFCNNYFSKMSNGGYSHALYLFHYNAKCTFNNEIISNPYNLLLKISFLGVYKFNYKSINSSYQVTDNGFLINSINSINPVGFNGYIGNLVWISETFFIKNIMGQYVIYNYILKILN